MAKTSTADQWQAFYEAAAQFRDAAPWRYVDDTFLFGVKHPDTGEIGWCCIMGNAGEYFALAVYKGAKGLDSYFQLMDAGMSAQSAFNPETFNAMFSQECWMISFQNAGNVSKEQKAHLKKLGLAFRGAHQWIVAETMDPGFDPWLPDPGDLPFLIHCLQQALGIVEESRAEPGYLDQSSYLVRTPVKTPDGLRWDNRFIDAEDMPEPEPEPPVQPSPEFLEKVKSLPVLKGAVVIASFFSPAPIQERKDWRPWRPMLLLGIAPGSGFIVSQEMAPLPEVPRQLERFLLNTFKTIQGKPKQIGVHSLLMEEWLSEICAQADIELVPLSGEEDYYADALEALSGMMG